MSFSRREFLNKGLLSVGATICSTSSWANATTKLFLKNDEPNIIIKLTAKQQLVDVGDGIKAKFWSYTGELIKGPKKTLQTINDSYLGPTIEVRSGDKVRIIFNNELPESSIVHWHGLDVSHENDGHPHNAIGTDETYQYDFVVENRAGTYWYHPHPHGRTGFQVYQGLAGLFIVRDKEEEILKLPSNDQELSFVIQDRYFNEDGQLEYRRSMMGAFGNKLFINGTSQRKFTVKQGLYRIRLLNGCNARIFNIAINNGQEIKQIASDGGLLDRIHKLDRFYFAPAERFEFLFDFSKFLPGDIIKIESLPLVEGRGAKYTIMEFEVSDEVGAVFKEPLKLSNFNKIDPHEAINLNSPKLFELIPKRGVGWTINGNGYEADRYEKYEIIKFGDTEVWEFYNPTGMPHPMHIHGTQFQVLKRNSGRLQGCLDHGWKDTVLVLPGDRVQVIKRFNTYKGTFIYHCHNLEHEDMSMMRNFRII